MDYSCQKYWDEAVIHGTKYEEREMDDYYPWNCYTRSTVVFPGGCICIYLLYSYRSIQTEYNYYMCNTTNECKILYHIMLVYKTYKYF